MKRTIAVKGGTPDRRLAERTPWVRRLLRCPLCEAEFVLRLVADGPYNLLLEVTRDGTAICAKAVSRDGVIATGTSRVDFVPTPRGPVDVDAAYPTERGFDDDEAPSPPEGEVGLGWAGQHRGE